MTGKYKLAIFDFDGTLADSFPFFLSVFNDLAGQHGFKQIDMAAVPGFRHCSARQMMKHVGLPQWKLPLVAASFTSMMKREAANIRLFAQVDEMLLHLSNEGVHLSVISSNSYDNVFRVLGPENKKLINHFECGMSIFGKASKIKKLLKETGIPPNHAIYIGDQVTDLEAARKAGVAFGAVAWGYGAIESLRSHSPEQEFGHISAIKEIA